MSFDLFVQAIADMGLVRAEIVLRESKQIGRKVLQVVQNRVNSFIVVC